MRKKPLEIKGKLQSIIAEMAGTPWLFAKKPKKDFTRKRKLTFQNMLLLLLGMAGKTIRSELLEFTGFQADTATVSAFIQQRAKLLPAALEFILHTFTPAPEDIKRVRGFRLLAVDGSDLHTPTNPQETESFIQTSTHAKGFNLLHLNALYDLTNGIYTDAILQNRRNVNEHKALTALVDRSAISGKVLVIADRGYEAYNNLAHIERKGWYYLIRVKDIASAHGILSGLHLPDTETFDVLVNRVLTKKQTNAVKAAPERYRYLPHKANFDFLDLHENMFYPISFRVVRFVLPNGAYETVITNLPCHFSPDDLKAFYNLRWGIETAFRSVKYAVGLSAFHSKRTDFITQEVFAKLIMYNLVAMIASHAFIPKKSDRYVYQVNFSQAVHVCRAFLRCHDTRPPDVEALLRSCAIPIRPGRSFPRNLRFRQAVSFTYRIA